MDTNKAFKRFKRSKIFLVVVGSFVLFGCGSGESQSGDSPEPIPTPPKSDTLYYAQDAVRYSSPTELFYVNLSNSMESSDGSIVSLTKVAALTADEACKVVSQDRNGFTIKGGNIKVCDYRYRVGAAVMPQSGGIQGDGYAEATVRTAVGEVTESLVALSSATLSNTSVTIDIESLLGLSSYTLDTNKYTLSDSVVLPNGDVTNSIAIADVVNNTIEYTPGSGIPSGVERILYSYSDGFDVLTGSIDVAVSTDGNNAPLAESTFITEYKHPGSGELVSKIPNGLATRIDVSAFITDPDNDPLQLIDVFSYDVTLTIPEDANGDGNAFNDTQFEFSSHHAGVTNVTYVVSDLKGGYATGVLQLIVSSLYPDIHVNDSTPELLFIPPLTSSAAEEANIQYTSVVGDGVTSLLDINTASHDWVTANGYCEAAGGSLPTTEQLNRLYAFVGTNGGLFEGYTWPQNRPYWTISEGSQTAGSKQAINLDTGLILEDETQEQAYYVACLTQGSVSVEVIGDSKIRPNVSPEQPEPTAPDIQFNYQLTATSTEGTETIDSSLVTWSADGNLPHYAALSSEGVITIEQSKVISTDKDASFSIMGCYESTCDDMEISVVFPWNGILTDGVYEFSPLMTAAEAGALFVTLGQEDTTNHSYKIRNSTLLKKEWQEIPPNQGVQYCNLLAGVGYEGGEWKAIDTLDVASSYVDVLAEKMNAIGDDGTEASDMVAAFNLQTTSGEVHRFDFNDNLGGASGYHTRFSGEVPNITQDYTYRANYPYSSYWRYFDTHVSHAVCYRPVK